MITTIVETNIADKICDMLDNEGYRENIEDTNNKKPFLIEDATLVKITLKGNIQNANKDETIKFLYGSNLNSIINLKIEIFNIFMQKALDSYRGQLVYEAISQVNSVKTVFYRNFIIICLEFRHK